DSKRREFPKELKDLLDLFQGELDKAEKRFGYRPTTKDFFDVYGRYTAVGLLPSREGDPAGKPGLLALIQLPGGAATAALQSQLQKCDLRSLSRWEFEGFPVFSEERKGFGTLYYGVGCGFLLIADEALNLKEALERLARARDRGPASKPSDALSAD